MSAAPDLIKPNRGELADLFSLLKLPLTEDMQGFADACDLLRERYGIGRVLLSLGKEGSLLSGKESTLVCPPPDVVVRGDIGAGDAMVAAAAWQMSAGGSDEALLRFASAAAGAVLEKEGTAAPDGERINELVALAGPIRTLAKHSL